jgi:hypothetical protein
MKSKKRSQRLRTAVLLPLVALVSALAIAACGGSSSSSSSGSTTKSTSSSTSTSGGGTSTTAKGGSSAERTKLQACLKKHGVTLPAGGFGGGRAGGGAPGSGTTPTGTPPAGANPGTGTNRKFTRPAGGFGGGNGGAGFAGGNSKFGKALKACGANFGGGGAAGGGGFRGGAGTTPHISSTVLKKFVACVRKNGYAAMPEASSNKNGSGGLFPKRIESNPKFEKASKQCASILQ